MRIRSTNCGNNGLPYSSNNCLFSSTTDQLCNVRSYCHPSAATNLHTIFGNTCDIIAARFIWTVDHLWIDRCTYCFQDLSTCKVNGGSTFPIERNICFFSSNQGCNHI